MAAKRARKTRPVSQQSLLTTEQKIERSNESDRRIHALAHVAKGERACPPTCYWIEIYGAPLAEEEFREAAKVLCTRWSDVEKRRLSHKGRL